MIRVLAMISVAGFLLSAVCLSIAVSLAGPEVISRGVWDWPGPFHFAWNDDRHHHGFSWNYSSSESGPQASRDLAWSGESLDVDLPADVHFSQADGPAKLVVYGPKAALDHLSVAGGHIGFDRPMDDVGDVKIELTAPKVTHFGLSGSGKLDITAYRQDNLDLRVSGDADVNAQGAAKQVKLDISGSGNADLSGLATDGAEVTITGSGQARVGPKAWAKLDISGSGDVTLTSHPARVDSHVTGSGAIDQDDGAEPPAPAEPPKPVKPVKPAKTV
jgi:hypothetical protein